MNMARLIVVGLVFVLLLSGCSASAYYQPIPKDTVMVKKIAQVTPEQKQESPGALSEEVIHTLSVNAINKYYNTNFSLEDLDIEVNTLELKQIKNMLYSFKGRADPDPLVQYKEELEDIPNGLYSVLATNSYDTSNQYAVMLDAEDGEIQEIQTYEFYELKVQPGSSPNKDEVIATAKQLLEQIGDIKLDELDLEEPMLIEEVTPGMVIFQNKQTKKPQVVLSFNVETKQLIGFSQNIMVVLSYPYLADLLNKMQEAKHL